MEYEFDYGISDEEKITQQILYSNARFDIKDVLSDNTSVKLKNIFYIKLKGAKHDNRGTRKRIKARKIR